MQRKFFQISRSQKTDFFKFGKDNFFLKIRSAHICQVLKSQRIIIFILIECDFSRPF